MQPRYLSRLAPDVQALVLEVEQASGATIEVQEVADLNTGGPHQRGKLTVDIEVTGAVINAPTNGYFPDGAVLHEVLHVRRLLVEGVPRLSCNDNYAGWSPEFKKSLTFLDNDMEHLVIVPEEVARYPDRLTHWSAVMAGVWGTDLPALVDRHDQRRWSLVHWTFVRLVLHGMPVEKTARDFLQELSLQEEADRFASELLGALGDKPLVSKLCFERLDLPKDGAMLEYLDVRVGRRELRPIP